MATKSSYFLAILLIVNPFMLLLFQNCTSNYQDRSLASHENAQQNNSEKAEAPSQSSYHVNKNLIIK